jgi:CRP/FNR family cyclic AMP-dependent transcriptional regulator
MDWLREIPLFADLTDQELFQIMKIVKCRTYKKRMFIFHQGDEQRTVYFVRSGTVKVSKVDEDGREQILSFLQEGDMFPHVGFFDDSSYPGTAEALEDCRLGEISVRDFEQLLLRQPKISITVMRVLGRKILELQQKIQDVTLQNTAERITHALVHLCVKNGTAAENGSVLPFRITNLELANMVGTSRETVNRVLNQLKKQGLVDFRSERIWVSRQLTHNTRIESSEP